MKTKIQKLLSLAGYERVEPATAIAVIALLAGALLLAAEYITKSWPIAISIFICLTVQLIDGFRSRIRKLRIQQNQEWPKYLDAIHSSTWAGASLVNALLDSRNYAPRNASWAFEHLDKDLQQGLDLDSALVNLKTRLESPIADRFVELTRLANIAGGRGYLPALRTQATQIRLENSTWQEVSAKQSWVVSSARLAVFAPWLILMMLCMRPETAKTFGEGAGLLVLGIGLVASLLAFRLVKYLGKIPSQQRNLSGL